MLDLRSEDIVHKSQLNRLLVEIVDQPVLSQVLAFKGGSCAAMLGFLDRFSVDLDFDAVKEIRLAQIQDLFHPIFDLLGFQVIVEFDRVPFFLLRYASQPGKRNSIKVSVNTITVKANKYKAQYFPEIDRFINSQTIETMFANKLVALKDRFDKHDTIAGRDLYDIHHFFIRGFEYNGDVILERTGKKPAGYFDDLVGFIREHVKQTLVNEDLNSLLPTQKFQSIRKVLIPETIALLEREKNKD